jgi:hypothetical protein
MEKMVLYIAIFFPALYFIIQFCSCIDQTVNLFWATVDCFQLFSLFLFVDMDHTSNITQVLKNCLYENFYFYDIRTDLQFLDSGYSENYSKN